MCIFFLIHCSFFLQMPISFDKFVFVLSCLFSIANCSWELDGSSEEVFDFSTVKTSWFVQRLDHFDATNDATWKQRVQSSDAFVDHQSSTDAPLFIMIGGEGQIDARWLLQGQAVDLAKKFKARLVQIEHRFYGKSHPTKDLSDDALRYLSSQQALQDLAVFIKSQKAPRVIVFGGSYPGSLAAWSRALFPDIITAAVSASAPLQAVLDFSEYFEVVGNVLKATDTECLQKVAQTFLAIDRNLATPHGRDYLSKYFQTCDPIRTGDFSMDVFKSALTSAFPDVVQYTFDNRHGAGNVTSFCRTLDTQPDLQKWLKARLIAGPDDCLAVSLASDAHPLKNTTWDPTGQGAMRQWVYQTCAEFGFFQSLDSQRQPFGRGISPKYWKALCSSAFPKLDTTDLEDRIDQTNIVYEGRHTHASNVLFFNGSFDPWARLGLTNSSQQISPAPPNTPIVFVPRVAHCAMMYPSASTDPPALIEARNTVTEFVGKMLAQ